MKNKYLLQHNIVQRSMRSCAAVSAQALQNEGVRLNMLCGMECIRLFPCTPKILSSSGSWLLVALPGLGPKVGTRRHMLSVPQSEHFGLGQEMPYLK